MKNPGTQDDRSARLPAHKIREIAVAAWTTPESVRNYLAGKAMKPILAARIAKALDVQDVRP